jgi:hypothetical protein
MKQAFVILVAMHFFIFSFGQEKDWRLYESDQNNNQKNGIADTIKISNTEPGQINLITSSSLDTLLDVLQNNPPELKGFRVRIYMGSSRKSADDVRSIYLKNEYEWQHYLTFREPNFIVEIGDFMTRLQAEKVKEELTYNFSNPYIVLTIIKPPEYSNKDLSGN